MPVTEMKRSLSLTKLLFLGLRPGFYFLLLVCYIKKKNKQASKKKYNEVLQHTLMMYYRSLHTLYQKGNNIQSLCFDAKRRKCHQYLYFRGGGLGWFFFCIPLYICQESKGTKTSGYLRNLPQLSGRYSQIKTAPVRFYFTLVRKAITNTSAIIPFDV